MIEKIEKPGGPVEGFDEAIMAKINELVDCLNQDVYMVNLMRRLADTHSALIDGIRKEQLANREVIEAALKLISAHDET